MNPLAPIQSIFQSLKGRHHRKYLKKCAPIVRKINQLEEDYQKLSEDELKAKTTEFIQRSQEW